MSLAARRLTSRLAATLSSYRDIANDNNTVRRARLTVVIADVGIDRQSARTRGWLAVKHSAPAWLVVVAAAALFVVVRVLILVATVLLLPHVSIGTTTTSCAHGADPCFSHRKRDCARHRWERATSPRAVEGLPRRGLTRTAARCRRMRTDED
ncbi:hypothetical protein BIW11_00245 [Tropilaelaps mercedesae]|uniref:Uncharacterized protein n=1 Tax=Tropilaelaps mercedesae TaxID=418985 RepID=A0A1V9XZE6_9ACAR|nr:hypothetical protein BIW11_00245 [Tropilaelaps mercedesae]